MNNAQKIFPLFFGLLIVSITCCLPLEGQAYNPILVPVIMVKNEESVIQETLQPFVDGGIDTFFVFDTGSTDNTVQKVKYFFEKNNILRGYIEQEPFVDFATSRNRALERAHHYFPCAAFIIMLDAEWYINDAKKLLAYCTSCLENRDTYSSYLIRLLNDYTDFYVGRLIRCNCSVHFKGTVHESIDEVSPVKVPEDIYFNWLPKKTGIEKSQARFIRDRDILFKEYHANPSSTRTLFYLARTCEDLGDLDTAYFLYKKRIKQIGWPEEDHMTYYRLAQTIEKLSYINKKYTWHSALKYYLKAYEMRPHRAEPLISIASYYVNQENMSLAFIYAHRACLLPYPCQDKLFVQKYAYDYYRYELLTRCAWYCGEFEIGEWAALKAMEARPDYEVALYNLNCYVTRNEKR